MARVRRSTRSRRSRRSSRRTTRSTRSRRSRRSSRRTMRRRSNSASPSSRKDVFIVGGNWFGNEEGDIFECLYLDVPRIKKIIKKWEVNYKQIADEEGMDYDYEDVVDNFCQYHYFIRLSDLKLGHKLEEMDRDDMLKILLK